MKRRFIIHPILGNRYWYQLRKRAILENNNGLLEHANNIDKCGQNYFDYCYENGLDYYEHYDLSLREDNKYNNPSK